MLKRVGLIAAVASVACTRDRCVRRRAPGNGRRRCGVGGQATCKSGVSIGMLAPITGPAASIGGDQLHWAQFYFTRGTR